MESQRETKMETEMETEMETGAYKETSGLAFPTLS